MLNNPAIRVISNEDKVWWNEFLHDAETTLFMTNEPKPWPMDLLRAKVRQREDMTERSVHESLMELEQSTDRPQANVREKY